jgi:ankyrin repeat protein
MAKFKPHSRTSSGQEKPHPDLTDLPTHLREAIRMGNAGWVASVLEAGASVEVSEDRSSPLAHAIACCGQQAAFPVDEGRAAGDLGPHVEVVGVLLDAGASAYFAESQLNLAASTGCVALVELFLERGADVNARDAWEGRYFTPLHVAAEEGHEAVARRLLDAGADTRSRSQHDDTPLHRAAWRGRVATVRLLLDRGAEVNARSHLNDTALHLAAGQGHVAVVQVLLEAGASVNVAPGHTSALHLAVTGGHVEVVRLLVAAGAEAAAPR